MPGLREVVDTGSLRGYVSPSFQREWSTMDWNICVVSNCENGSSDLNNALLYGTKLYWITPRSYIKRRIPGLFFHNQPKGINDIKNTLDILDFDVGLNKFRIDQFLNHSQEDNAKLMDIIERIVGDSTDDDLDGYTKAFNNATDGVNACFLYMAHDRITSSHASILHDDLLYFSSPTRWRSHQAAQDLMNAMQRVILPDVSNLTLEEVKKLQERAKDELEPMRAEMLRLTTDLRTMLGDNWSTDDLAREAKNLIAVKVEPSVRDLSHRIKSDVKITSLGYGGQLLKTIGLLGFGRLFQNEKTVEKAFTEATNFLGDKVTGLPTPKADNAASQYVIEIQKGMVG